ncbi:MAG: hypothetical protein ACREV8_11465 [Gammaproteobacteria bacterium]
MPATISLGQRRFWTVIGLAFAAHIPDERLAALVHMHVLNADNLRATAPQTAWRFDLGCVGAQQSCNGGRLRVSISAVAVSSRKCSKEPKSLRTALSGEVLRGRYISLAVESLQTNA